jgi:hypothetical protein
VLDKNWFGYFSLVFVVLSGAPYIYSTLIGKTRPHVFTQLIWALTCGIAGVAQYVGHAGPGAWAAELSAVFCIVTVLVSFSHGERNITRSDWVAFLVALSAIPLWYLTESPLPSVILVTFIDVVGYYPTFRKSYIKPKEEMIFSYVVSNIKHIASMCAMTEYSLTTLLFPAALFVANGALIAMLVYRRWQIRDGTAVG